MIKNNSEEAAEALRRFLQPESSVSTAELREYFQSSAPAPIVDVRPGTLDVVVTVERPPTSDGNPVRECYAVRPVTTMDGEAALQWSYLGPVDS